LPGVKVKTCTQIEGQIYFLLRALASEIVCPHCNNYTEELHQNRPTLVRDLSVFRRLVYLEVPRRQFYCPSCQRYITEKLEFIDKKRRHTQRYEQNIYARVQQSSMEQIGREEGLSYHEIKVFLLMSIPVKKNCWESVKRVSIDEISMRKGKGSFVTVVSDIEGGNLMKMIDSHRQQDIVEVLMRQSLEVREQVEEVSVDMWEGFQKVIEQVWTNAQLVIDRFHVMKAVNKDLNKLRRGIGITDRGSKYLLLSNRINLEQAQIEKLEMALKKSECLRIAYEMKEEFREIYETNMTVKIAQTKFKDWLNYARIFFQELGSTSVNHFE
jgi:transposase